MGKERKCIKCGHTMLSQMVQEVEVDVCPNCGGLWLDRDEIRMLAAKSSAQLADLRKVIEEIKPEGTFRTEAAGVACPVCGTPLTIAWLGPIQVEHCMSCDGLFLDKGELDKAVEMFKLRGDQVATVVALARSVFASGSI